MFDRGLFSYPPTEGKGLTVLILSRHNLAKILLLCGRIWTDVRLHEAVPSLRASVYKTIPLSFLQFLHSPLVFAKPSHI